MTKFLVVFALSLAACGSDTPAAPPSVAQAPQPGRMPTDSLLPVSETISISPSPQTPIKPTPDKPKQPSTPTPSTRALPPPRTTEKAELAKHNFTDVAVLDPSIRLDIRYATTNNFMHAKIYDCPRCLLRPDVAIALAAAQKALQKKGMGLKMHDCYRPRPYQQRLWDKKPDANYVTPPAKGSMHSRGAAVDLTIVDAKGNELDMGTPYDFLGPEAHTDNLNLPESVLANRALLRKTLAAVGFKGIRTEWWHFSFQGKEYPLDDFLWDCNQKQ